MSNVKNARSPLGPETQIIHSGRPGTEHFGAVNTPVYHASTILFPTFEAYEARLNAPVVYGRSGTPTTQALEAALAALEEAEGALLLPSGVAAIALVLSAYAMPGAHYLIPDAVYEPVRKFCGGPLQQYGVSVSFYDPCDVGSLEAGITAQTRLIWLESPASQTFEVQDCPAIVEIARRHGIATAIDNTWATGYFFKPLPLGVDISIQAATKYIGGHSDIMMGSVAASGTAFAKLKDFARRYGQCVSGDDAYLALRGLRTLSVRLDRHNENALAVARYLDGHPAVVRVMHPALPGDAGHAIWRRDFTGASGLFGFVAHGGSRAAMTSFFNGLKLFGMGGSWGGFESLLIPTYPGKSRAANPWAAEGQTLRIHVGLETPGDLIEDLDQGLRRWSAAG